MVMASVKKKAFSVATRSPSSFSNYPIHLHENGVDAVARVETEFSGNDRRPVSAEPVTVITDTKLMNGGRDFASVHFENNREASGTVRADPFFYRSQSKHASVKVNSQAGIEVSECRLRIWIQRSAVCGADMLTMALLSCIAGSFCLSATT